MAVAQVKQQLVGVDALGCADRGDDGCAVVVGREQLEPHRLHAGARCAAEAHVALERRLETVVEDQPERDVEAADDRDGRCEGGVENVLRLLVRTPVEVEGSRRLRLREHALGHRGHRQAGRAHQGFLGTGDDDVDPPGVGLERHSAERRDRVDDERHVADRLTDPSHIGDDAGRGIGLLAEDDLRAATRAPRRRPRPGRATPPLVPDRVHVEPVALADRDPALAEGAVADHGDPLARPRSGSRPRTPSPRCPTP